ncbi:Aste57867_9715 [Aphanomyces stellatus]|uniref:Aste57867_9715 protein n=1 Tax=Aphanomyces stellatus TaxID=120398 RepID=A0A485KNY4_9STRA|nr:hypothetical protein As57867_009677 [Aphanomyces stellatus]VFT86594.1 Aste57867_9715 [Aphanomyces stellatus]
MVVGTIILRARKRTTAIRFTQRAAAMGSTSPRRLGLRRTAIHAAGDVAPEARTHAAAVVVRAAAFDPAKPGALGLQHWVVRALSWIRLRGDIAFVGCKEKPFMETGHIARDVSRKKGNRNASLETPTERFAPVIDRGLSRFV